MSKEKLYEFVAPATVPWIIHVRATRSKEAWEKLRRGDIESAEPDLNNVEVEPDYFLKGLCEGYDYDDADWEDDDEEDE